MARRLLIAILLLAALPAWPGCSSKNEPQQDAAATGSAPATASPQAAPDDEPELPPFVKPTLADVDAKADWQPMPVLDAMKLLEEKLKSEKPPLPPNRSLISTVSPPLVHWLQSKPPGRPPMRSYC